MEDMFARHRRKRNAAVVAVAAVAAVLLCIYAVVDPADSVWARYFPKCPVKMLTGLDCPSCGIQRAIHATLRGEFAEALRLNLFIPFSLLYLGGMLITRLFCRPTSRWRMFFWGLRGAAVYISAYLIWFVVRNILGI